MLTDKIIHPEPPAADIHLPPAGEVYVDPTFNTPILRVTDENDGASAHHVYAAMWPMLNRNNTRGLILRGSPVGPTFFDFNETNLEVTNKRHAFAEDLTWQWGWARWSEIDPDIIYSTGHRENGNKILAVNVRTGAFTVVKDFEEENPGGSLLRLTMSTDDNTFSVTTRNSAGYVGFQVWSKSAGILCNLPALGISKGRYCKGTIDKSGRYWTGNIGGSYVRAVVDCFTNEIVWGIPAGVHPIGNWGHGDDGHGIACGIGSDNTYRKYDLSDPNMVQNSIALQPQRPNWRQSMHGSLRGPDDLFLVSTYAYGGDAHVDGLYYNEVYVVRADGSGDVQRLAHHHSYPHSYWASPRAVLSMDGRVAAWTSDWHNSRRYDVFLCLVESDPDSDPGPDDPGPDPTDERLAALEKRMDDVEAGVGSNDVTIQSLTAEVNQLKADRQADQGRITAIEIKLAKVKADL